MEKLSIIIPAYNEEKRIENTLSTYTKFFDKIKDLDYEILVVINNTKDNTKEIVEKHKKKNKKIRYLDLERGGKGYAVTEGFKDALKRKNTLIGFVDADMATPPEAYHYLIKKLENSDGIIASRYIKGSIMEPKPTFQRKVSSRIFNTAIRTLLFMPYRDTQCGAKLFKRETIEKILPQITFSYYAFDVDLLYAARRNGFKIKEAPTKWADKGLSKINFLKAGPRMFFGVVRLRLLNSPLKGMVRIYDKFLRFVPK